MSCHNYYILGIFDDICHAILIEHFEGYFSLTFRKFATGSFILIFNIKYILGNAVFISIKLRYFKVSQSSVRSAF